MPDSTPLPTLAPPAPVAYNAGMGASTQADPTPLPDSAQEAEISAWLRTGGLVVAASERAARALAAAFHRARRAEGLAAWPAPAILDWQTFLRTTWREYSSSSDARLLLDPLQEQSIWTDIAGSDQHMATLLEGPRNRMARLAIEAHKLLCSHAPQFLKERNRAGWQQDAANFSVWLSAFEKTCRSANLLSPARLPLELISLLEASSPSPTRPPLLLAGFDRMLPTQRRLFEAWGQWQQASSCAPARDIRYYSTPDTQSELAACAIWCKQQLAANPNASLLVVTQDITERRGEIERAFLNFATTTPSESPLFEFSLGIPLSQVSLAKGAHLLLRWLSSPFKENSIAEHELDWLLSTGQTTVSPEETIVLQTCMRALRRRNKERPRWPLSAFLAQHTSAPLPPAWVARITEAQSRLAAESRKPQSPLDWAELVPQLLQTAGWPGSRILSTAEFQSRDRFLQTVESCASLGFDGRRIRWHEFLAALARALDQTLFAPESRNAPIQIAGPAESAGLTADAIWFMGASEAAWPASGSTHPLLPPEVQREAAMPHATAQFDWELSRAITLRLLHSAPQINFSFARQSEDVETRSSRLIAQLAAPPQPLPAELTAPVAPAPLTVLFEDASRIPFPPGKVEGGSAVLTHQSQCPFKAFATARLAAQSWQPAEAGLTAAERGNLLHAVLHSIWSGPPLGIHTHKELQDFIARRAVAATVHRVFQDEIRPGVRDRMPRRYLELEEMRLVRLVGEWLDFESTRIEFEVIETEARRTVSLASLTFDLRLDRIDRLNDNSLLVIDYKTGQVSPKSWQLPRPDDVQLPLYARFALDEEEVLGGLVFAKVRSGDQKGFAGHVGDAKATLLANLSPSTALMKAPLTAEMLIDWKENIEQLARDFLSGRAEVDPSDYPETCKYCGLESLCRIAENRALLDDEDTEANEESADE